MPRGEVLIVNPVFGNQVRKTNCDQADHPRRVKAQKLFESSPSRLGESKALIVKQFQVPRSFTKASKKAPAGMAKFRP